MSKNHIRVTLKSLKNKKNAWEEAVIVFSRGTFNANLSEEERSFKISSSSPWFNNTGTLFGINLKSNERVNLTSYMSRPLLPWKIEYCYILK